MNKQPHDFLYVTELFYTNKNSLSENNSEFEVRNLTDIYEIFKNETWTYYQNVREATPMQGWKIHISSDFEEATTVLEVVSNVAIKNGVSFKHLVNKKELLISNSKNQNRATSGKFVVLYPTTKEQFLKLLYILEEKLKGFKKAAYILSDRRWKNSNVYYRYGGFISIYDEKGNLCIKDKEGNLIKDERLPYYNVPDIAKDFNEYLNSINDVPEELESDSRLSQYDISEALSFSNSGGVYLATIKKDGKKVIIKEARDNTGLDSLKRTAKERLRNEKNALQILNNVDGVINVIDYFKEWEHEFLVEEYAEGDTLHSWVAKNFPFISNNDNFYRSKLHVIMQELIDIVNKMHENGVVMGDLQPHNIFIDELLKIKLIDFETASNVTDEISVGLAVPAFSHFDLKNNVERDWFGLYKIFKFMLLPIYTTVETSGLLDNQHNKWIDVNYGTEFDKYFSYLKNHIKSVSINTKNKHEVKQIGNLEQYKDYLISTIINYSKDDKYLTSNDYKQFMSDEGRLNIDSGAFGVLWALSCTKPIEYLGFYKKWISAHINQNILKELKNGLFDGKSGIIITMYKFGYHKEALECARYIDINKVKNSGDLSLFSGQAGIGLFYLDLYIETQDQQYLNTSLEIADNIIKIYSDETFEHEKVNNGLLNGWSGISMFFTSLYKITKDHKFKTYSKEFLDNDIKHLVESENTMQLHNKFSNSIVPYVYDGSGMSTDF
ncbi:hypothetical protein DOS78_11545 [Staphylococcus felis]|uniref:class III lanthionine synthetase LanKC n=1 Tax=Staphylococcus felis TaxID=46127 RepID=UPI000E24D0F2|nr:class III lanthionine synthetase LanKC [Staphylococcus felis]REH99713.1 hypothetical protein DOS65_10970 [Staphylococcus felis]REI20376.1 hypothetical protein DOS78_11545 [Staphylococcus felis]